MDYFDQELLDAKRALEREKYATVETGMYVGEELLTFKKTMIPDSSVSIWLPNSFVLMTEEVKKIKYPSANAPPFIITSLDFSINIGFSFLPIILDEEEIKDLRKQFQTAITNDSPAIKIQNQKDEKTEMGNDMSWFDFCGYNVDGQSYNRNCLIRLQKNVFHGIFNCRMEDKNNWFEIVGEIFKTIEEDL